MLQAYFEGLLRSSFTAEDSRSVLSTQSNRNWLVRASRQVLPPAALRRGRLKHPGGRHGADALPVLPHGGRDDVDQQRVQLPVAALVRVHPVSART